MRWLFALILATVGGLAPGGTAWAQQVDPYRKTVYVACYAYTIGQSSAAYLPVVRSTAYEMFHNLESKVYQSVLPHPKPSETLGCKTGDTPEAAEAARIRTGYVRTSDLPWPKDVDPLPGATADGWAGFAEDEIAVVCSVVLRTERNPNGTSLAMAARPLRVPDELRRPRTALSEADLAKLRDQFSAYFQAHQDRFHSLLAKARPAEADNPTLSCRNLTRAQAAARGIIVGARAGASTGADGPVKLADFLPADWARDLSGATAVEKVVASPKPTPPPKPAQTGYLEVKTDTSAKDAAKAWDEQVKKTLATEAQKRVETAAKTAQADAKYKAEVEAFFAERRRQGRAQ